MIKTLSFVLICFTINPFILTRIDYNDLFNLDIYTKKMIIFYCFV